MRQTRIAVIFVGAVAATLATAKGRRLARRSVAAYFQPSIDFLPENSNMASGRTTRP